MWALVHDCAWEPTFAGHSACSPCLSMSAALLMNSHTNASGQLQHCLTVPRMAVATALMELPPDMRSMFSRLDGGVLLGAHQFQATLTLPMPESPTGMSDYNRMLACHS